MDDEKDALDPAFALLDEVPEGERGFLPHLALDEVEAVPFAEGFHREEAVFGDGTVKAVVEGYIAFSADLEQKREVTSRELEHIKQKKSRPTNWFFDKKTSVGDENSLGNAGRGQ